MVVVVVVVVVVFWVFWVFWDRVALLELFLGCSLEPNFGPQLKSRHAVSFQNVGAIFYPAKS